MKLKELREEKGLSQSDLASVLNVAQNTISQWENGTRGIDNKMTVRIANFFEVSTDYLLGNDSFGRMTQDEKLIILMQRAEKNHGLKLVFDKTADLNDKELEKLSKMIDIIKEED